MMMKYDIKNKIKNFLPGNWKKESFEIKRQFTHGGILSKFNYYVSFENSDITIEGCADIFENPMFLTLPNEY